MASPHMRNCNSSHLLSIICPLVLYPFLLQASLLFLPDYAPQGLLYQYHRTLLAAMPDCAVILLDFTSQG